MGHKELFIQKWLKPGTMCKLSVKRRDKIIDTFTKLCPNCNNFNHDNAVYCEACGVRLTPSPTRRNNQEYLPTKDVSHSVPTLGQWILIGLFLLGLFLFLFAL